MYMKQRSEIHTVLQFKITLNDSVPRVWRRILVPSNYTFFDLHCAIQCAMGWFGGHLHAFYIGERRGRDRITIESPNPEGDDPYRGDTRDERREKTADYFGKIVKQCVYCYDFGDNWDHTILLERILPREIRTKYPQCTAGKNACPPEDCGGVWGYKRLRDILKNPQHSEHTDMMDWLGIDDPQDFDPHAFDLAKVVFEDPKKRLVEWNRGFGI